MEKRYRRAYLLAILVVAVLVASPTGAFTDRFDAIALRGLYKTLNQPQQLTGWKVDGGDPCDESWNGVSCFGSSVIYLKLNGLNLSGYITPAIYYLFSLKQLDISFNSIGGEIPYILPPNVTHINMAYNHLIQNIPPSLPGMKSLRHLNLSHNWLSGPIGNVFTGLQNLREMDLSYNKFTGDLPSSFGSLKNLGKLFIQNNSFTGGLDCLSNIRLFELNIEFNHFCGELPIEVKLITYLRVNNCSTPSSSPSPSPPSPPFSNDILSFAFFYSKSQASQEGYNCRRIVDL